MEIFGGKDLLTASAHRRNMWRTLTLLLVAGLTLGTEVSQYEDIGLVGAEETMTEKQQGDFSGTPSSPTKSRREILAAQFECYLKIITEPPRTDAGSYCNRTWDGWLCWGDSAPGTVMQSCPGYFFDFDPSEKVTKVCNSDGQWFHHPESKRVWSNYTQCTASTKEKRKVALGLYYMAMVGNSLSIVSLLICLVIFSYFKSLSCQRVSLHKNTFFSFILNSVVTMIWYSLSVAIDQDMNHTHPASCKMLTLLHQYTTTSIYFWMLCEGIYLHTLIIVAVFVGEQQLFWYYVLGWGFPVVPAITYGMARWHFFNDKCWVDTNTRLLYIIHGPIYAALIVNFFFLLNIVRVLITKLKKTHCAETTAYMKAVRATLILIPLLGIEYVILFWSPEGSVHSFFIHIFSHFQGLLVAIIFCFCNSEAQTAVKRKWAQWRSNCGKFGFEEQPTVSNHFSYHSSSLTETSRATISLELPNASGSLPSPHKDTGIILAKVTPNGNGLQKRGKSCSNGEVDARKMETTVI